MIIFPTTDNNLFYTKDFSFRKVICMYTGTQKKAIVLKNTQNCIFEEAYFILKDDFSSIKESEMVKEANKILKNNIIGGYFFDSPNESNEKRKFDGLLCFLSGSLISFILCTVLFLFIK